MRHMTDSSILHDHVEKELVVLWAGKAGSSFLQMVTAVRSWAAMTEFLPKDLLAAVIKSFIVPLSCTHSSTKLLHNASIETYTSSYHPTLQLIISSHNQAYRIGNSWVFWHSPHFETQLGKDQKLPYGLGFRIYTGPRGWGDVTHWSSIISTLQLATKMSEHQSVGIDGACKPSSHCCSAPSSTTKMQTISSEEFIKFQIVHIPNEKESFGFS